MVTNTAADYSMIKTIYSIETVQVVHKIIQ